MNRMVAIVCVLLIAVCMSPQIGYSDYVNIHVSNDWIEEREDEYPDVIIESEDENTPEIWHIERTNEDVVTINNINGNIGILTCKDQLFRYRLLDGIDGEIILDKVLLPANNKITRSQAFLSEDAIIVVSNRNKLISVYDTLDCKLIYALDLQVVLGEGYKCWWFEDYKNDIIALIVENVNQGNQQYMFIYDLINNNQKLILERKEDGLFCIIRDSKFFIISRNCILIYNGDGVLEESIKGTSSSLYEFRKSELFKTSDNKIYWFDDSSGINFNSLDIRSNNISSTLLCKCGCECGYPQFWTSAFYNVAIFDDIFDSTKKHVVIISNTMETVYRTIYSSEGDIRLGGVIGKYIVLQDDNTIVIIDFSDNVIQQYQKDSGYIYKVVNNNIVIFINNTYIKGFRLSNTNPMKIRYIIGYNELDIGLTKFSIDSNPMIHNNRTLLSARYVVEPLGGQVFWDGDERKVACKLVAPDNADIDEYKENVVELWIDKPTAKVNGVEVQIDPQNPDVTPTIIDDRTFVPVRFLAESLGCEVEWVSETKEIILTYTP